MQEKCKFLILFHNIRERLVGYINIYDPGYLALFYSLKTLFASILSLYICVYLFGPKIAIWAGLMPIYLYFLNVALVEQKQSLRYFIFFIFLSMLLCIVFSLLIPYGLWLVIPLAIIGFCAGLVGSYDLDLQKVFNMAILNGLIACIYADSRTGVSLVDEVLTIFIGGVIGLIVLFFMSFKKYGKFVRKYFPDLLLDLELMIKNLHRTKNFVVIRNQTSMQIESIKKILNSKSGNIKDPHIMKNTKRALFYLYRIEEIYQCINAIHNDKTRDKQTFSLLKREIIFNLREVSKMLEGHMPRLKTSTLEKISTSQDFDKSFVNTIKIIYNKIDNFRRGGQEESYFIEAKKKKSLNVIFKSLHFTNGFFRYGVKYSFALSFAILIAQMFHLDHGVWIAMACVAIIRPNFGGVQYIGKEYIIGVTCGLVAGLLLIVLTKETLFFYPIFMIVMFLFVYLKVYPYGVWASFMMMAFIMMFFAAYGINYLLIFDRFMDIFLAFVIVLLTFLFWPKYSGNDILPNIQKSLDILYDLYDFIMKDIMVLQNHHQNFYEKQKQFFDCYNTLDLAIREAKKEKNIISDLRSARDSLKFLDFLNQEALKIFYFLMELDPKILQDQKELYLNDLNLIKTRYEMMNRALQGSSFYFKKEKDDRFLSQDNVFSEITNSSFEVQNQLFVSLQANVKIGE
ncbi:MULTISPECIES: FUSC family protein [unclassified Helicobacter]|uniref:FUSC family protein n=1 Tax=unclassified Helicobacter TaxID=2593540 RepID=UPI000CF137C2|nr:MULTISPECIES: FUSC family protein [unclassified Helicobacter]